MTARPNEQIRNSSALLGPQNDLHSSEEPYQDQINIEEILSKMEFLTKENRSLKEANRRHMPYNMQAMLMKCEESEQFYRDKMYEKRKRNRLLQINNSKSLEK
jgi:hypothetical protein